MGLKTVETHKRGDYAPFEGAAVGIEYPPPGPPQKKTVTLEDGTEFSFWPQSSDAFPFRAPYPGDSGFARCRCGSESFRIAHPEFVCTVAECVHCGERGEIHQG